MSKPELKLTFLGGASEIGASCTLVESDGTRLLVDCGVRFNADNALPDLAFVHGKPVDAVAVTHAHSDHTGGLPVVSQTYPDASIYATPPTRDITMILLRDALKLMDMGEREDEVPLYAEKQVAHVGESFLPVHHGEAVEVGEMTLTFLPAGHILGASMIHVATKAGNVLFTGDYSVSAQHTVPALSRPLLHTDMVVTEATYGDRLHEDREAAERRLVDRIREVVEGEGRVLIPAFAVGRAQEILLMLKRALRNKTLPEVPVHVDGMVRSVCAIYGSHDKYVSRALFHEIRKAGHPFYTNGIAPVERPEARAAVLEKGPCVIVASSGMLSGGASVFYASELLSNTRDAVLITGFQDEESPGRALLDLADAEAKQEIKLAGRVMPVKCRFEKYGLSAHADRMQMVGLIESLRPRTVVLVHGDETAKNALASGLSAGDVVLAENGRTMIRSYPLRRTAAAPPKEARRLDLALARRLLGPAKSTPVHARQVAEAWYGRPVNRETSDRLVRELESLGLVRRDDSRRQMLHVLSPSETDAFPAEAAQEEALKKENPKGKLLEYCMRERISAPEFVLDEDGAFHTAHAVLRVGGVLLESGAQSAATKRAAEQLAARALLRALENRTNRSAAAIWIGDDESQALRVQNPKGRLLERCAALKAPSPLFEVKAVVGGFHAEAVVTLAGKQALSSGKYGAAAKKGAEQAAAKALLERIDASAFSPEAPSDQSSSKASASEPAPSSTRTDSGRDPMMLLNEMRQLGLLEDFGYDTQSVSGPSHQPLFSIIGWALTENEERIEADPVTAPAKKAGRRVAAQKLMEKLRELGLLAGTH